MSYIPHQSINGYIAPFEAEGTHVAKVARPVLCTLRAKLEINSDFKILRAEDLLGAHFVDLFRLTVHQQRKNGGTIGGNERDVHASGIERS